MVANSHRNSKRKFDRFSNPESTCIPDLWNELRCLADVVPLGEAGGVHRLRTSLLASVPPWRLPEVLDSLAAEGAAI